MLPAGGTDWVIQSEAPFSAATMTVWKKNSHVINHLVEYISQVVSRGPHNVWKDPPCLMGKLTINRNFQ